MASGWNLWVWLQCIGVASRCCCKEVIDILIIIINFPYSTCIRSFLAAASLLLCSFLNDFSVFIYIYSHKLKNTCAILNLYCTPVQSNKMAENVLAFKILSMFTIRSL